MGEIIRAPYRADTSKLAVNPQDAVPLTVVNLRTAIATPRGNLLEEELRELLQFRLSYEPVIFLLERQRMEELQAEKRLGSQMPSRFGMELTCWMELSTAMLCPRGESLLMFD